MTPSRRRTPPRAKPTPTPCFPRTSPAASHPVLGPCLPAQAACPSLRPARRRSPSRVYPPACPRRLSPECQASRPRPVPLVLAQLPVRRLSSPQVLRAEPYPRCRLSLVCPGLAAQPRLPVVYRFLHLEGCPSLRRQGVLSPSPRLFLVARASRRRLLEVGRPGKNDNANTWKSF